jgi:hypothetical protein
MMDDYDNRLHLSSSVGRPAFRIIRLICRISLPETSSA